ncbi:hypothetical protein VNO77_05463 [Canavalia gladiata]|uniref:Uncharacterized protein n=1 Tax=Canavalia gladiata TaxID=3824 RepID=A0AAN9N437_CANGL
MALEWISLRYACGILQSASTGSILRLPEGEAAWHAQRTETWLSDKGYGITLLLMIWGSWVPTSKDTNQTGRKPNQRLICGTADSLLPIRCNLCGQNSKWTHHERTLGLFLSSISAQQKNIWNEVKGQDPPQLVEKFSSSSSSIDITENLCKHLKTSVFTSPLQKGIKWSREGKLQNERKKSMT